MGVCSALSACGRCAAQVEWDGTGTSDHACKSQIDRSLCCQHADALKARLHAASRANQMVDLQSPAESVRGSVPTPHAGFCWWGPAGAYPTLAKAVPQIFWVALIRAVRKR